MGIAEPLPLSESFNPDTNMLPRTTETGTYQSSRRAAAFAAQLVANGTPQELALAEKVLDAVLGCQERREGDPHYGSFKWVLEDDVVQDLNAVEFNLEYLIPMMLQHRVPFMISIALNSLARYLLVDDDDLIKRLIVQTADDMLEHCLGPDGVLYYKELPSLCRPAPTVHAVEALTHAYRLGGERRFLQAALRQFVAYFDQPAAVRVVGAKRPDEDGAVIQGSGGREFAASYASLITFIASAVREGLLTDFEYPV